MSFFRRFGTTDTTDTTNGSARPFGAGRATHQVDGNTIRDARTGRSAGHIDGSGNIFNDKGQYQGRVDGSGNVFGFGRSTPVGTGNGSKQETAAGWFSSRKK